MDEEKFKDVEIGTDEMNIMLVEISLGVKKERSKLKMTPYMSDFWDKLEKEIKNMPKGAILDIIPEIPG